MTEETGTKGDEREEAIRIYKEGVRFLEEEKYEKAAEMLAKALEIKAKCVEEKDECMAEWYYRYGCALYYHYKSTAEVLGDRSKKEIETKSLKIKREAEEGGEVIEEEGGEEDMEEGEEVEEGGEEVEEGGEEVEEGGEEVEEGGEEVEEGGEEVEEGGEEVEEGREEVEEGGEGVEEGGELGREEGEGENDLEIAWNVLEMARLIYSQSEGKKMELSEVHILLGEIALEEEKLDLAQSEIEKALELRLGLGDRRALAHAHFMLALVLEWKQDDQAVIDALERSRSLLYEEMKSVDEERVEEIKQTIEQIENKIQAVKDTFSPAPEDEEEYRSKSVSTSISEQVRELMSSSPAVATSSVKQPVQQLVARKRLGPREGSPEAKKPKCESSEAEKPRCEN